MKRSAVARAIFARAASEGASLSGCVRRDTERPRWFRERGAPRFCVVLSLLRRLDELRPNEVFSYFNGSGRFRPFWADGNRAPDVDQVAIFSW